MRALALIGTAAALAGCGGSAVHHTAPKPPQHIAEDDPGWNCHTMGNRRCGPGVAELHRMELDINTELGGQLKADDPHWTVGLVTCLGLSSTSATCLAETRFHGHEQPMRLKVEIGDKDYIWRTVG
jgi:hypothetical protein